MRRKFIFERFQATLSQLVVVLTGRKEAVTSDNKVIRSGPIRRLSKTSWCPDSAHNPTDEMRDKFIFESFQATLSQLFVVLTATLGSVSEGMHYAWTAPILQKLERPDSPIKIMESDHMWLESIYLIGGIFGLPCVIGIVDRIGRKGSILLSASITFVSWIVIGVANQVTYLYVARFFVGLSGVVAFVAAPMYIAEIADKHIRGFLSGMVDIMMLIGILLIYSLGPFTAFYVPSIIGVILAGTQLITLPFLPESPYYLISKHKPEKAKRHLQRLRGEENVDAEMAEIAAAIKRQRSEKGRPQDLILSKSNRKALLIMLVLNGAQHFSCISVLLMNLHEILTKADSKYLSAEYAGISFASVMLVSAIGADFVVDKFGRKALLTGSSLLTGLSLLSLALYFTLKLQGFDTSDVSWIPFLSVVIYAFVFKFGLGIIPIMMSGELFPSKVKAIGMASITFFYVFFAWLAVEIYQQLSTNFSIDIPLYLFASSCILTAIFVQVYVPETKGKSLEEVQFILKGEPYPVRSSSMGSNGAQLEMGLQVGKQQEIPQMETVMEKL